MRAVRILLHVDRVRRRLSRYKPSMRAGLFTAYKYALNVQLVDFDSIKLLSIVNRSFLPIKFICLI